MTRICFDSEIEVKTIRQSLNFAQMALKLKDDNEVRQIDGLEHAHDALSRCTFILSVFAQNPSINPQEAERFYAMRKEATAYVAQYAKEFDLRLQRGETHAAPSLIQRAPKNGGAVTRTYLTHADVTRVKQLLSKCGPVVRYADVMNIRDEHFPNTSITTLRSIAVNATHQDIPWPGGKTPIYETD